MHSVTADLRVGTRALDKSHDHALHSVRLDTFRCKMGFCDVLVHFASCVSFKVCTQALQAMECASSSTSPVATPSHNLPASAMKAQPDGYPC